MMPVIAEVVPTKSYEFAVQTARRRFDDEEDVLAGYEPELIASRLTDLHSQRRKVFT